MDVSLQASVEKSNKHKRALLIQQQLKNGNANNAFVWNGAVGAKQLKWLKKRLRKGEGQGFKTILFSHLPLLPENGLQLWNNRDVLNLLNRYPSVVAFVAGHHHEGGYVKAGNIHHLTLKGLVESRSASACGVVKVYPGRLLIEGFGDQLSYALDF
jgi:3',5'-cyclic AMP phosphodiesterase CpdA